MPIKRTPKSGKRRGKSAVVPDEGTSPGVGGDTTNPVEGIEKSELLPNSAGASSSGTEEVKEEIGKEIGELGGNSEEVDNVVGATMGLEHKVKEETVQEDQDVCAGDDSGGNNNLDSGGSGSLVSSTSLDENGEPILKNIASESEEGITCVLNSESIVGEEDKCLEVKDNCKEDDNVAEVAENVESIGEDIDGSKDEGDAEDEDDDNVNSREDEAEVPVEAEEPNEAVETDDSKLQSAVDVGPQVASVEPEALALEIKEINSLAGTGGSENSSASNGDDDGEEGVELCEDYEEIEYSEEEEEKEEEEEEEDEEEEEKEKEEEDEGKEDEEEVDEHSPEVYNDYLKDKKKKPLEIYVGGLGEGVVEEDLIEVFGKFGELLAARIVKNPATNKSKGFAFIQYSTVEQAKNALSESKDGIEVKGKRVEISVSQENDTLFIGNICKTWTKENVFEKLKCYGIQHIETIHLPDVPDKARIRGFALLEFSSHSDALAAFQRLRKSDVTFGCEKSPKVSFAHSPLHESQVSPQAETVYLKGFPRSWDAKRLEDVCKQYGDILEVRLPTNFSSRRKDFGFVTFASRESALACVEGITSTRFDRDIKVKAEIAKTQSKRHVKGAGEGIKVNKEHGKAVGQQRTSYSRSGRAKKESERKEQTGKSKNGTPSKLRRDRNVEQRPRRSAIEGQDIAIPPKADKHDRKRKNLTQIVNGRGKRGRSLDYNSRPPEKQRGNVRDKASKSLRDARSKRYPARTQRAISGSKRPIADMEPHAGFLEPSKKQDRHYVQYLEPGHRHQGPSHVSYVEPAYVNHGQAHGRSIAPPFRQQQFDSSSYRLRRTDGYHDHGSQRIAYVREAAVPASYVASYPSYGRYERERTPERYYSSRGYPSR